MHSLAGWHIEMCAMGTDMKKICAGVVALHEVMMEWAGGGRFWVQLPTRHSASLRLRAGESHMEVTGLS
jgi:hypothetical protein